MCHRVVKKIISTHMTFVDIGSVQNLLFDQIWVKYVTLTMVGLIIECVSIFNHAFNNEWGKWFSHHNIPTFYIFWIIICIWNDFE